MAWAYEGRDQGIGLFTACLNAGMPFAIPDGAHVLDLGCCEADWLHLAADAWPTATFTGVDVRAPNAVDTDGRVTRIKADALNPDLFPAESFDAVVSLSAVEHFGLGHYGDPKDQDGDSKVVANVWRWLKPGGLFYFDVPYDPEKYWLKGTECRVYDWEAINARLLKSWSGPMVCARYSHAKSPGILLEERPTISTQPFYYIALALHK